MNCLFIEPEDIGIHMTQETLVFVYDEALKVHGSAAHEINDKLKFLAEYLSLYAKLRNEEALIEIKALTVLFKYRSKSRTYWVFDMPEIEEKDLYIEYLFDLLNDFKKV